MPDDPRWFESDWTCQNQDCQFVNRAIRSKCRNCGRSRQTSEGGPKDVFVGLPQEEYVSTPEDRAARIARFEQNARAKPLCHQDPCNDPACRLDHADRKAVKWYVDLGSESHYGVYRQEIEELESRETMPVYDGDLSRYWER